MRPAVGRKESRAQPGKVSQAEPEKARMRTKRAIQRGRKRTRGGMRRGRCQIQGKESEARAPKGHQEKSRLPSADK